jgi:alpha-glucosidase
MPWEAAAPHAGFSRGRPWLPLDAAHRVLAVDRQEPDPSSTLAFTRTLLALRRQHPALRLGSFDIEQADEALLVTRRRRQDDVLWLAFNLGATARQVTTPNGTRDTILALQSARVQGALVDLPPHSAIFLRLAA